MTIYNTFSKVIYEKELTLDEKIYDTLYEVKNNSDFWSKDNIQRNNGDVIPAGASGSNNKFILDDKKLIAFKDIIMKEFEIFKNEYMSFAYNDFKIITSWFTSTKTGDKCDFHNHHHCMFSGVFYIAAEENSGNIVFCPFENYRFELSVKEFNINNSHSWYITPKKGKILFFDSSLFHKIEVNQSNKERISLAFNLIPIGEMGVADSYINLG